MRSLPSRPRLAAALAGAVLIGSLFAPWYGFESTSAGALARHLRVTTHLTGWQAFSVVDIVLAACGAVMLVAAVVAVRAGDGVGPRLGRVCLVVAFVAVGVTLWRVFDHPAAGLDLRYGGLLALA